MELWSANAGFDCDKKFAVIVLHGASIVEIHESRMKNSHVRKEELEEFYCLTWSFSQGAFHTGKLLNTLESGRNAYLENRKYQDYIVIDISTSELLLKKRRDELIAQVGWHPPTQKIVP